MNAQSKMSDPVISPATPSAISSQELGSGHTPCDSLGGLTIAQFGPALAPANLSHRQAKAMGLEMSGICGRRGSTSSRSAALQSSLASRLQARTASAGSILFTLTWKQRITPSGLSISALRASGRRTFVSDSGLLGWPTPRAEDAESSGARWSRGTFDTLSAVSSLAGWPTPVTQDAESAARHGYMLTGNQGTTMLDAARLATWATPTARDEKVGSMKTYRERGGGAKGESLSNQAASLCGSQPTTIALVTGPLPICALRASGRRDEKYRPVEPGTLPLAHGSPARMGRLRGFGNAIVATAAQAFIESTGLI